MRFKTACVIPVLAPGLGRMCIGRIFDTPAGILSANYRGLSVGETKETLENKRAKRNHLVYQQNNAAIADTVSVALTLLPLGSIFGADKEGDLAQAKGEVLALEGAVSINCKT